MGDRHQLGELVEPLLGEQAQVAERVADLDTDRAALRAGVLMLGLAPELAGEQPLEPPGACPPVLSARRPDPVEIGELEVNPGPVGGFEEVAEAFRGAVAAAALPPPPGAAARDAARTAASSSVRPARSPSQIASWRALVRPSGRPVLVVFATLGRLSFWPLLADPDARARARSPR